MFNHSNQHGNIFIQTKLAQFRSAGYNCTAATVPGFKSLSVENELETNILVLQEECEADHLLEHVYTINSKSTRIQMFEGIVVVVRQVHVQVSRMQHNTGAA